MSFIINGTQTEFKLGLTVGGLLREKEIDPQIVGVGLNGEVLSRNLFDETPIRDGDNIDVFKFVGGG
ncbi:MAG: sulfur carrier protein ThiS [Chitinivibrionia bacterium]|nr:sulfur carrier protein ThiS [Chitinivibrionia bacterium]